MNAVLPRSQAFCCLFVLDAEGGTRTRTTFRVRGFSYRYGFRHLIENQFAVWTMPSPYKKWLGGSRLASTLCQLFTSVSLCQSMTVRTKNSEVFYSIISSVAIDVIKLKRY